MDIAILSFSKKKNVLSTKQENETVHQSFQGFLTPVVQLLFLTENDSRGEYDNG